VEGTIDCNQAGRSKKLILVENSPFLACGQLSKSPAGNSAKERPGVFLV
jgi:hypothetical protein